MHVLSLECFGTYRPVKPVTIWAMRS